MNIHQVALEVLGAQKTEPVLKAVFVYCAQEKYDLCSDVNDFEAMRDIPKPYDANLMRRYPVSMKPNNLRIDDAESASPVMLDTPTQANCSGMVSSLQEESVSGWPTNRPVRGRRGTAEAIHANGAYSRTGIPVRAK